MTVLDSASNHQGIVKRIDSIGNRQQGEFKIRVPDFPFLDFDFHQCLVGFHDVFNNVISPKVDFLQTGIRANHLPPPNRNCPLNSVPPTFAE